MLLPMRSPLFRHGRRVLLIALAAMGIALLWSGNHRVALPPTDGEGFESPPATAPVDADRLAHGRIRVGTYNIDGGRGIDGHQDLQRIANVIAGCDLVALNEVHGTFCGNQSCDLGRLLKLPYLFAPVERRWWHDDFGNGALCALPIEHWQRFPLSTARAQSNRNVVLLRTRLGARIINVLITHIEKGPDHSQQMDEVTALFSSLSEPSLLLGDLNTQPDDAIAGPLQRIPGAVDVINSKLPLDGLGHIDWIFTRGMRCTAAGRTPMGASDHPFFWAEFELP